MIAGPNRIRGNCSGQLSLCLTRSRRGKSSLSCSCHRVCQFASVISTAPGDSLGGELQVGAGRVQEFRRERRNEGDNVRRGFDILGASGGDGFGDRGKVGLHFNLHPGGELAGYVCKTRGRWWLCTNFSNHFEGHGGAKRWSKRLSQELKNEEI